MNEKFLRAVGLAVVTVTIISLFGWIAHAGLGVLGNFIDWLKYNVLPYALATTLVSGVIYAIYSAAKK
jgi:hypothetical protein